MGRSLIIASLLAAAAPACADKMKLPPLKKQLSAQAVLDEHMDALNHCDWNRIVAQYPDGAQINLPGGAVVKGRAAIRLPRSGSRPRRSWPSPTRGPTRTSQRTATCRLW